MSKTSELVERYVMENYKAQISEANSNPYLGIYGVIFGIFVLNLKSIHDNFLALSRVSPWFYTLFIGILFLFSFVGAGFLILVQATSIREKEMRAFEISQEISKIAAEERAMFSRNNLDLEIDKMIDESVSEIVRLRITQRVLHVNKVYRYFNEQKASAQRYTAFCLLMAAVAAFSIFNGSKLVSF